METLKFVFDVAGGHVKGRTGSVLFAFQSTSVKGLNTLILWPDAFNLPIFTATKAVANQFEVLI
jgi:hypothetical protein